MQPYVIMFEARGRRDEVVRLASLCAKTSFATGITLAILIWLFAEPLLHLWFGSTGFPGYAPLAFLVGAFLIDALCYPQMSFLTALNRHRWLAGMGVLRVVLNVALGAAGAIAFPADPFLGIASGMAAASLLGQGVVLPAITIRELGLPWRRGAIAFAGRPLLLLIPGGFAVAIGSVIPPGHLLARGVLALASSAVTWLGLWYVVAELEERRWILQLASTQSGGLAFLAGLPRRLWPVARS
jgi:hypothetical protein